MRLVLRSLGVVYACPGCPAHGDVAREAARLLEARALGEMASDIKKARARYPVVAIDGCAEGCVRSWLAQNDIEPHRHYVVAGSDARRCCEAIAADLQ